MYSEKQVENILDNKTEDWIKFIIKDSTNKEIIDIRPKPNKKNNWLYIKNLNKWIGICECINKYIYTFEIYFENENKWGLFLEKKEG